MRKQKNNGKSSNRHCKSTINGPVSIALMMPCPASLECSAEPSPNFQPLPQPFTFRIDCRGAKGNFQNLTLYSTAGHCGRLAYKKYYKKNGNSSGHGEAAVGKKEVFFCIFAAPICRFDREHLQELPLKRESWSPCLALTHPVMVG